MTKIHKSLISLLNFGPNPIQTSNLLNSLKYNGNKDTKKMSSFLLESLSYTIFWLNHFMTATITNQSNFAKANYKTN